MLQILNRMIFRKRNRCRKKAFFSVSKLLLISYILKPVLGKTLIVSYLLPVLFSCTSVSIGTSENVASTPLSVKGHGDNSMNGKYDIFTFDNSRMMNLDSYQQGSSVKGNTIDLRSQNGDKTVFLCINSQWDRYEWSNIRTFDSLSEVYADLRKEKRGHMLMTGQSEMKAGNRTEIIMRPVAGEIILRSIKCDFTGKSYEGQKITDVTVYLTNVNVRCSILEDDITVPTHLVNAGGLNMDDMDTFLQKDLILQHMESDIGSERLYTDLRLYCYPNTCTVEGPGTPFTRLVIEGSIEGERYWWPIDINHGPGTEGTGIGRSTRHMLDVVIRRKGSKDPDDTLDIEYVEVNSEIKPWEEKDDYRILF